MRNDSFPFISLITGLILTELQRAAELLCLPAWAPTHRLYICLWEFSHICVRVSGWHKVNGGVHLCICLRQNIFFFFLFLFMWVRVQMPEVCVCECSRPRKMCCTGWLQRQANAAFNEGGGESRGKHRKLNWYVNDGNSHLSWRLRVLQH